jgi:hypothetical protein
MGWYDVAKDALSVAQKAGNIELYQNLLNLEHDMQDMQQENYELKKQLQEIQDSNNLENEMEVSEDKKSFFRNHNDEKSGPYCPVCWQKDKKLSFLTHGGYKDIDLICPICQYKIDLGGNKKEGSDAADAFAELNQSTESYWNGY